MLTPDQEKHLLTIPEDKVVKIHSFDPKIKIVVSELRKSLKESGIKNKLLWIGASALGVAGQNDIDFHIFSKPEEWNTLAQKVTKIFGERIVGLSIFKWELEEDGFEVELYLSDPESEGMRVQIEVFSILKDNPDILQEYEKLKIESDGILFREYMKRKYEFYHKILGH